MATPVPFFCGSPGRWSLSACLQGCRDKHRWKSDGIEKSQDLWRAWGEWALSFKPKSGRQKPGSTCPSYPSEVRGHWDQNQYKAKHRIHHTPPAPNILSTWANSLLFEGGRAGLGHLWWRVLLFDTDEIVRLHLYLSPRLGQVGEHLQCLSPKDEGERNTLRDISGNNCVPAWSCLMRFKKYKRITYIILKLASVA